MRCVRIAFTLFAVLITLTARSAIADDSSGSICSDLVSSSIVLSADQPKSIWYCKEKSKREFEEARLPIHFANASQLDIVIKDINPIRNKFVVSFSGQPFAEIDGSALAKLLGVTLPTSGAGTTKTSLSAPVDRFPQRCNSGDLAPLTDLRNAVVSLSKAADSYRDSIANAQDDYNETLMALRGIQNASPEKFKGVLNQLGSKITEGNSIKSLSNLAQPPRLRLSTSDCTNVLESGNLLADAADKISKRALMLYGEQPGQGTPQNGEDQQRLSAEDKAYVQSVFYPTGSSLIDRLKSEIAASSKLASTIVSRVEDLQNIADNPSNFRVVASIPPENRIQTAVTVKVSWAANDLSLPAQSGAVSAAGQQESGSQQATPAEASKPASSAKSPASDSFTFTINFGQGPRTFQSAGIVFSPLAQHSYSTVAVGSSANCPTTVGTTTQLGCVVDNADANWRILPVALASVRIKDLAWSPWRPLIPNYFSFGATIKSNAGGGAALEYLTGLSWASPGQHVFFTAGGYAGEVTKLAGGLSPGPQAVALPSALPTSTPYRWKFGFAISYKIGSQGASGSTSPGKSDKSASPSADQ
jgi:hypothetical protein